MDGEVRKLTMMGMTEIQRGGWDGGQYSYLDGAEGMGVIIELLENFNE